MRKNVKITVYLGLIFAVIFFTPVVHTSNVSADGGLSLSLARNVGIGIGSNIQGRFTAKGSAPGNIVNLSLVINGIEVDYVEKNELSFQFSTGDFPSGVTNITLYGWDAEGTRYSEYKEVNILEPVWAVIIGVATGILVIGLLIVKYGKYFKQKKNNASPDQIKIDKL
jgi:hypothetical protein